MALTHVGPVGVDRSIVTGSTLGNTALISALQNLVGESAFDWIASDSYGRSIVSTPGIVVWYRLSDANQAAGLLDSWGNANGSANNGTYAATGVTYGVTGTSGISPSKAASFDGSSGSASIATLNLSAYSTITVEFWLKWTTFANDDHIALEHGLGTGSPYQNVNGGWYVNPDSSYWPNVIEFAIHGVPFSVNANASQNSWTCARPSSGVFHHFVVTYSFVSGIGNDTCSVYIDGVSQTLTRVLAATVDNAGKTFANSTLSIMNRSTATGFAAGTMNDIVIYNRALTVKEITNHWNNR